MLLPRLFSSLLLLAASAILDVVCAYDGDPNVKSIPV